LPLHYACWSKCDIEVAALLIKHWPDDVQANDKHGQSPLHMACVYNCDAKVLALLIEQWQGALRAFDKDG